MHPRTVSRCALRSSDSQYGISGPALANKVITLTVSFQNINKPADDVFCMTVVDCKVDNGEGQEVQLIDESGCGVDINLLGNLDYPMDLMAIKEAHVFKFADRAALYFNCQIKIAVHEPNDTCVVSFLMLCLVNSSCFLATFSAHNAVDRRLAPLAVRRVESVRRR